VVLVNIAGPFTLILVFLSTPEPYKLWLKKFGLIDEKNGHSSIDWTIVRNNKRLSLIAKYLPVGNGNTSFIDPSSGVSGLDASEMQSEMESNMNSVVESSAAPGVELTKNNKR